MLYLRNLPRWFHSKSFRSKILLSFLAVAVLPIATLGSYIVVQKSAQAIRDETFVLEERFSGCMESLEREIGKVDGSLETIALDPTIFQILTGEHKSEYEKYYQVTKHFDAVIETILATTDSIESLDFYVPNSLQRVRMNFHSLESLTNNKSIEGVQIQYRPEWFFDGKYFHVFQRVYTLDNHESFAMIEAKVRTDSLIDDVVFGDVGYLLSLRDGKIYDSSKTDGNCRELYETAALFNGNGSFGIYRSETYFLETNSSIIALVVVFLLAFFLLLFAIYLISGSLVKRLNYVNTGLASIVANNFETTLVEDYDDEIGHLTRVVNQMIRDTKSLIEDVYQSELKQKEYEFKALQAQINPHFLYNVLSAINWRLITTDNMEVSSLVTMLSKFYRTALNKGKRITTIMNEVENIRAYLDIQLSVHSNSFDVEYEVDQSLLGFYMPNLIVQPIVENALEHGIDHLEDERGCLKLILRADGAHVVIEVINNGPEIENIDSILAEEGAGYGLFNVNKRLGLFFGSDYELRFHADPLTRATIRFPRVEKPE